MMMMKESKKKKRGIFDSCAIYLSGMDEWETKAIVFHYVP